LLGVAVTITQTSTLMGFGIISEATGPVRMALYQGSSPPLTFVAAVENQTLAVGRNDYMMGSGTTITLDPGTYWVFANVPAVTSISHDSTASTVTRFMTLDYSTALPATFTSTSNYNGSNMNYYILVLPR
jgi:hypothetical protein